MDLQIIYRAGAFIRDTLKRALSRDDQDLQYSKRLALDYKSTLFDTYMRLLDHPIIKSFLWFDICNLLADNYLIAMTYIYLERAQIVLSDQDIQYFFSALYLAHEIQEDGSNLRKRIIWWYPGGKMDVKTVALHYVKNYIWFRMNFKCHVTKQTCDNLMRRAPDWSVWQRNREESHAGAFLAYDFRQTKCKNCSKHYLYNPLVSDSPNNNNNEFQDLDDNYFENSDWETDTPPEEVFT